MVGGNATPATIILWTKGLQKVHLRTSPEQHPFPGAPTNLQNSEDLQSPPLALLCTTTHPLLICQKAVRLACWLAEQGLA